MLIILEHSLMSLIFLATSLLAPMLNSLVIHCMLCGKKIEYEIYHTKMYHHKSLVDFKWEPVNIMSMSL